MLYFNKSLKFQHH